MGAPDVHVTFNKFQAENRCFLECQEKLILNEKKQKNSFFKKNYFFPLLHRSLFLDLLYSQVLHA